MTITDKLALLERRRTQKPMTLETLAYLSAFTQFGPRLATALERLVEGDTVNLGDRLARAAALLRELDERLGDVKP